MQKSILSMYQSEIEKIIVENTKKNPLWRRKLSLRKSWCINFHFGKNVMCILAWLKYEKFPIPKKNTVPKSLLFQIRDLPSTYQQEYISLIFYS